MNIKERYVNYFIKKGHVFLKPASLVPDDSTTLFTSSGIQQLVPFMVNEEEHPLAKRLTNYQKCLRLTDIDNIGDSYHHTFFEMLGNWSMNDYFKREVIDMSYDFLTKELGIEHNRLAVTVFGGVGNIPRDDEAASIWIEHGIPKERIAYLGFKDNWWPSVNEKGPCGTDTEIFYWRSDEPVPKDFDPDDDRWVEIWNNVFVEFSREDDMSLRKLKKHYIDTGMGVERMTSILNNLNDNFKTELFVPIMRIIEKYSGKKYDDENNKRDMRIIADHIRAIVMICSDDKEILPSNKDKGYVLKRLIRRMIISSYNLGVNDYLNYINNIVSQTIDLLKKDYPYILNEQNRIISIVNDENNRFFKIIQNGNKKLQKALEALKENNLSTMDSSVIFKLYETHGIPFDLIFSFLDKEKINYNRNEVYELFEKHKELSRLQAKNKFGEGIANNKDIKVLKK